jgi:hypothetical protein
MAEDRSCLSMRRGSGMETVDADSALGGDGTVMDSCNQFCLF